MLSLQSGIYDATTEEGRQQIQELEAAAKERAEHGEEEEEGVQGLRIEEEDESLPVEGQQFEEKGKGKGKA